MKNAIGPISILGEPEVGKTLIIRDNGMKDPDGINHASKEYLWFLDGDPLPFAKSQQLIVSPEMQGATLSAGVRFFDKNGSPEFLKTGPRSEKHVPYQDDRMKALRALYRYLLKREPDRAGIIFWSDFLKKLERQKVPYALARVIEHFMSSDSFQNEIKKLK